MCVVSLWIYVVHTVLWLTDSLVKPKKDTHITIILCISDIVHCARIVRTMNTIEYTQNTIDFHIPGHIRTYILQGQFIGA